MTSFRRRSERGFTLIEMLVVIAIISILIGIGVNTFTIAQKKARDVRRKADLATIQKALEAYKLDKGTYPLISAAIGNGETCLGSKDTNGGGVWRDCWRDLLGVGNQYMPKMPVDPIDNWGTPYTTAITSFIYAYNTRDLGITYSLYAQLENTQDKDAFTRCAVVDCNGYQIGPWANYKVTGQ